MFAAATQTTIDATPSAKAHPSSTAEDGLHIGVCYGYDELVAQLAEKEAMLARADEEMAKLKAENAAKQRRIDALEGKVEKHKNTIAELKAKMAEQQRRIDALNAEMAALKSKAHCLETKLEALAAEFDAFKKDAKRKSKEVLTLRICSRYIL